MSVDRSPGCDLTQITDFGPDEERAAQPSWTSDGRITFTHIAGANDEELTVAFIDADGSGLETALGVFEGLDAIVVTESSTILPLGRRSRKNQGRRSRAWRRQS